MAAKDEAAAARDKAREGSDDTMKDFRENRNFSLRVGGRGLMEHVATLVKFGMLHQTRASALAGTDGQDTA